MRLVAFIATGAEAHPSSIGDDMTLRTLLPMSAATVLERQARDLRTAGVDLIIVEGSSENIQLASAVDRLKQKGVDCHLAIRPADLLSRLQRDDRILLVADSLVASPDHLRLVASARAPTILSTDDDPLTNRLERLDAKSRWAGLAVIPASSVAALAQLPGEWDMVLTLLRTAVQGEAHRISCAPATFAQGELVVIEDGRMASMVDALTMRRAGCSSDGLVASVMMRPLARRLATLILARTSVPARSLGWIATGLFTAAPVLSANLGLLAGGVAGLLATLLSGSHDVVTLVAGCEQRRDGHVMPRRWIGIAALITVAVAPLFSWSILIMESVLLGAATIAYATSALLADALAGRDAEFRRARAPDLDGGWLIMAIFGAAEGAAATLIFTLVGPALLFWALARPDRSISS